MFSKMDSRDESTIFTSDVNICKAVFNILPPSRLDTQTKWNAAVGASLCWSVAISTVAQHAKQLSGWHKYHCWLCGNAQGSRA